MGGGGRFHRSCLAFLIGELSLAIGYMVRKAVPFCIRQWLAPFAGTLASARARPGTATWVFPGRAVRVRLPGSYRAALGGGRVFAGWLVGKHLPQKWILPHGAQRGWHTIIDAMRILIALWQFVVGRIIRLLRPARRRLGWAALLPLVAALYLTIWGVHAGTIVFVLVALAIALAIPVVAADVLPLALIYLGLHWLVYALVRGSTRTAFLQAGMVSRPVAWVLGTQQIAISSPAFAKGKATTIDQVPVPVWKALAPGFYEVKGFGAAAYTSTTGQSGQWTVLAGFEVAAGVALLLFGGWLVPRTIGMHTRIMRRNRELSRRVRTLTATRVDAIDTAARPADRPLSSSRYRARCHRRRSLPA